MAENEVIQSHVSIQQVFEFAMDIEKKGMVLYSLISNLVKDKEIQNLFEYLAHEEERHYQTFLKRKSELSKLKAKQHVQQATAQVILYMKSKLYNKEMLQVRLQKMKDLDSVFDFAISAELEQIMFYNEIRSYVFTNQEMFIDEIIAEERGHFLHLLQLRQGRLGE